MAEDAISPVVTDHPERGRFEITVGDELAGAAYYHRVGGALDFTHTEVDGSFEGHGIGSILIKAALDAARAQGADVLPHCPFVRAYIQRHDEYLDLVPVTRRAQFGLAERAAK